LLCHAIAILLPAAAFACPPLSEDVARQLTLEDALARVDACHPTVRGAQAALAAAQADLITAGQRPNPQLTVGAGNLSRDIGSGSLWSKTFDHQVRIDQTIERGDKAALRQAAARAALDAADADLIDTRRQARLAVSTTYYDLAAALARGQEVRASAELNRQSLDALERRVRAGDAAPVDATRLGLDALRVQADIAQAEAEAQALRSQLAGLIGAEALASALTPRFEWPSAVTAPSGRTVNSAAIQARPDVVAARARVAAARGQRALARAQRTRDVGIGLQVDRYPVSATNTSGSGNTVSVFVSVPLFVRHAFEGENARAEADVNAAEETLRRTLLGAQGEVQRALAQWQAAQARRELLVGQLEPSAQKVADAAEIAYRRGATSVLDVLDARRSLRAAHIERINAEADLAKAQAALEAATRSLEAATAPAATTTP
jgi:cobalt-zinc-cadmium efflux system outer membrane protein